jgi:hypothetical protein
VAGVGHLEQSQFLVVVVDHFSEPAQQPRPVGRGDRAPRRRAALRRVDGPVGLVLIEHVDRRHGLLGGGVDHREGAAHSRSNPR